MTFYPRSRQRASLLVLLALVAALLLAERTPPAAEAGQTPVAPEAAAAGWLADAYADGEVISAGGLSDLIFALSGVGLEPGVVADALADLDELTAAALAEGPLPDGALAKTHLAVAAAGGDVNDFAGADLEAELRSLVQTEGADAGRIDDATVFTQALGVLALETTPDGAPPSSSDWLSERRCPEGGWPFALEVAAEGDDAGTTQPCTEEAGGDVDTTALVIQSLRDTFDQTASGPGGPIAWLLDQQGPAGDFAENTNSTGLAAQALRALGEVLAADDAADFVASLQKPEGDPDSGAFAFRADANGSLLLATTQGLLAFGAPALQDLRAEPAPADGACGLQVDGVTVVVDLTFFDGGEVLTRCAVGDPATGLDALREAGFDITTQTAEFGEFVCAIEGLPGLGCEQPFEGQFWTYAFGQLDGTWGSYEVGADVADPAPGDVEGWRYDEGLPPGIAAPGAVSERLAGPARIETAIAISRAQFDAFDAGGVVLARADSFPDALAGTPLAAAIGGPLLTTGADSLPESVVAEVQRVLFPGGGTVYVLGGQLAISADVETALRDLGYDVIRVAGDDRVTTSLAVADEITALGTFQGSGGPLDILLTTGESFADALSAGTAAGATGAGVVLLTPGASSHPAIDAYLVENPSSDVYAIGGPSADAYPQATPIVGATRIETAVLVAETFFEAPTVVGLARADDFADALAGGALMAQRGGPLLVTPTGELAVTEYVCSTDSISSGVVFGGEAAVSADVSLALAEVLGGSGCP